MFQSKDGKKFGSSYVAKRKDSEHDKMAQSVLGDGPEHEAAETPEFEKGEQEGAKEAPEQEKPEQVVAKHGPATQVTIHHDHKGNKHHIVSRHADGHIHSSDHATADEAHKSASTLSGGDQAPMTTSADMGGETASPMSLPKLA